MHEIKIKRIYQDPADEDGKRVLVDRLWPRGVSKERAHLDASDKIPPYEEEIKKDLKKENVTFLYAAKSEEINHARILKAWMDKQIKESEK